VSKATRGFCCEYRVIESILRDCAPRQRPGEVGGEIDSLRGRPWKTTVLQSEAVNQAFYETEVAFGLTTLLRIHGFAHAVGSVAVEPVLRTGARAYRVTSTARLRNALSEILTRRLKRPFQLEQPAWVITAMKYRPSDGWGLLGKHTRCSLTRESPRLQRPMN